MFKPKGKGEEGKRLKAERAERARVVSCCTLLRVYARILLLCAFCLLPPALFNAARAQQEPPAPPPQQTPSPTPTPSPAPDDADDSDAVESIDTDLTNVLLTAMDRKRNFVTTLRQEDVRVLEDGVEQQLLAFHRQTDLPLSIVFLVDTSASQEAVLKDEQEAARAFVESVLRPGKDTAAVLSFTGVTRIEQPLTGDFAMLKAAVDSVKVLYNYKSPECLDDQTPEEVKLRCLTGVWDAVAIAAAEVLARTPEQTRRAVILLSDGDDTSSKIRIYQAVEIAVRHNAVVYSIGIRDEDLDVGELKKDYLRNISEETGGRAFFPKNRRELDAAFAQIGTELRSQYLLSYTPSNRAHDGRFRRIQVEITNPALRKQKLRLLYRQGYYGKK